MISSSASGAGLLVTTEQLPLRRSFINSKESNSHGNPSLEEEEEWTRPILRQFKSTLLDHIKATFLYLKAYHKVFSVNFSFHTNNSSVQKVWGTS